MTTTFDGDDVVTKEFHDNIWWYNNAFAFILLGVNWDHMLGLGPYCLHVYGKITHKCGVLLLEPSIQLVFAQLYVHDPNKTLEARMQGNLIVCLGTMSTLRQLLLEHNHFVPLLK
jgi:hypothetical protein